MIKNGSDSEPKIKENMKGMGSVGLELPIQQRLHIWLMNRIKQKLESIETTMDCNHENSSSNTISQPYQIFENPPGSNSGHMASKIKGKY